MHTSKTVYSYEIEHQNGHTVITAQQWPWAVLQVVPTTSATFDAIVAQCKEREGFVATHGTDRTFCIIQLSSGDQGGKYPDRHVDIFGQETARKYLDAVQDQMAQAATWYYTNIIEPRK